jgi:hypothetical protein
VDVISSSSTQGQTQVTLEFNQDREIDKAAVDVQAALLRAQKNLPVEMTIPPSYRKVNPADAPIIFVTLTSPSMALSELNKYADNLIAPTISTINGVAQINVNGQKRFAVRVRARPDALAARNMTMDDLAAAIKAANANTPVGTLDGPRQTLVIEANKQLTRASDFAQLIVAQLPGGNVVRLADVADVEDSVESVKTASWVNGERSITLSIQRQPDANTVATVDAIKAALPGLVAQVPSSVSIMIRNDRSVSIRARHPRREGHARHHRGPRRAHDLPLPAAAIGHHHSGAVDADLAHRHDRAHEGARAHHRQRVAARHHARGGPGRGRRGGHAREHRAPRGGGDGALRGGDPGRPRDGLHHLLDLDLARRGLHSHLLHAGRDRRALPRIRHRRLARDPGVGGRVAHARADAREPLPQAAAA